MNQVLLSWIGRTDLRAAAGEIEGPGPIGSAVADNTFDEVVLLSNYGDEETEPFIKWLQSNTKAQITWKNVELPSPMDFGAVYEAADRQTAEIIADDSSIELTFHLSPGTSAMCAMWLILAATKYDARLIASSPESGVYMPEFPFDIAADYVPRQAAKTRGRVVSDIFEERTPAAFEKIIHKCDAMKRVIRRAQRVAEFDVPVMILGESGTGKELFAEAIHKASPRSNGPYVTVNCGAFPKDLVESELFGHVKGAFTGADTNRVGRFEEAHGGTLFLDELGELPLPTQVKLLRVLQEGEIRRVGAEKNVAVDVRIVCATNRDLPSAMEAKEFREDLFHRLAIGILNLPPLRDRKGDLKILTDHRLKELSEKLSADGLKLSAGARNVVQNHTWPGNIRELFNALTRAAIWREKDKITEEEMAQGLLRLNSEKGIDTGGIMLGDGFDLAAFLTDLERKLVNRARSETSRQVDAAALLGISGANLRQKLKKYARTEK